MVDVTEIWGSDIDGTDQRLYLMVGFDIINVEPH